MDMETVEKIFEFMRASDILDDIIKLIFENTILSYDGKELNIYDSGKLLDYIKLKYPYKYEARLKELQAEKENKEQ